MTSSIQGPAVFWYRPSLYAAVTCGLVLLQSGGNQSFADARCMWQQAMQVACQCVDARGRKACTAGRYVQTAHRMQARSAGSSLVVTLLTMDARWNSYNRRPPSGAYHTQHYDGLNECLLTPGQPEVTSKSCARPSSCSVPKTRASLQAELNMLADEQRLQSYGT